LTPSDVDLSFYNPDTNVPDGTWGLLKEGNLELYLKPDNYKAQPFQPRETTRGIKKTYSSTTENLYEFQLEIFDSRKVVGHILYEIFDKGRKAIVHDYHNLIDRNKNLVRENITRGYAIRTCRLQGGIDTIGGGFLDPENKGYGLVGLGTRISLVQIDNLNLDDL